MPIIKLKKIIILFHLFTFSPSWDQTRINQVRMHGPSLWIGDGNHSHGKVSHPTSLILRASAVRGRRQMTPPRAFIAGTTQGPPAQGWVIRGVRRRGWRKLWMVSLLWFAQMVSADGTHCVAQRFIMNSAPGCAGMSMEPKSRYH